MKAVLCPVPPEILAWRKRSGADRWDEMWEGVLHMAASPNREHQDLEFALESFIRTRWAKQHGARVVHNLNVAAPGGWPHDYRIPDLMILTRDRFALDFNEYVEGPPNVVIEIQSPGDETEEKLSFYARIGVPEAWVVDRDTKAIRILVREERRYEERKPRAEGWVLSPLTELEFRSRQPGRLEARVRDDDATREELP